MRWLLEQGLMGRRSRVCHKSTRRTVGTAATKRLTPGNRAIIIAPRIRKSVLRSANS